MIRKFVHGVLPAVILALCVGSIYAFSLFSPLISEKMGCSLAAAQFAFSLGIFGLGLGTAFFGPIVEKNIKAATVFGTLIFVSGLAIAGYAVKVNSLALLYIGYGFIHGFGVGIIYISPVKTCMLWFKRHPAVASAISIISFGCGSSLTSWMFKVVSLHLEVWQMLPVFGLAYAVPMALGCLLLKKPSWAKAYQPKVSNFSYLKTACDGYFVRCFLFMFLSISSGLALIGPAASILKESGWSVALVPTMVAAMGVSNGLGRFVFAWICDRLERKQNIMYLILFTGTVLTLVGWIFGKYAVLAAMIAIPAVYGAAFSCLPAILSSHYGMSNISKLHGFCLLSWSFAGLCGNQFAVLIRESTGSFEWLFLALAVIYAFNTWLVAPVVKGRYSK